MTTEGSNTQPVHVPRKSVEAARKEAERLGMRLGEGVAHLIEYALARKAALARDLKKRQKAAKPRKKKATPRAPRKKKVAEDAVPATA